jgi:hypothetical protein
MRSSNARAGGTSTTTVSYGVKGSETEEEGEVDADDGISGVPLVVPVLSLRSHSLVDE